MLFNENEIIYVPDGEETTKALERTNILCFAAHQDDTEIMAFHAIQECQRDNNRFFTSVIITDGGGSPRTGIYEDYSYEEIKNVRANEQNKAAGIGNYSAQIQLNHKSDSVRNNKGTVIEDIIKIIMLCQPEIIYTHNLADKHKTHVAVALRVIEALNKADDKYLPEKLIGLEVWRGLDWLDDKSKMVFDASNNQALANELLQVFDSQISGGKRYDSAALGRRSANATFFEGSNVDSFSSAIYGIDMTELLNGDKSAKDFILSHIDNFRNNVEYLIDELS